MESHGGRGEPYIYLDLAIINVKKHATLSPGYRRIISRYQNVKCKGLWYLLLDNDLGEILEDKRNNKVATIQYYTL